MTENSSEGASPSLEDMLASAMEEAQKSDSPTETAVNAEETGAQVSTETASEIDPAQQTIEPPAEMSAEQREGFKALPVDIQRQVADRYADVRKTLTQKTEEIAKERSKYQELETAFEPYREQLSLQGVTPAQAAQKLLAAQNVLTRDPVNGLKWLAQSLQIDLRQLAPSENKEEEYLDPQVKALKDEVGSLKAQLQQFQVGVRETKVSEAQKIISDFKDAKDAAGNLLHPHFENADVQAAIAGLVSKGKTLDEAYTAAVYVLPEVREKIAQEAAKAAQAEAAKNSEEARKKKLTEAKTAAQTIRSRGAAEEKVAKMSLEDSLRAAMREVS